MYSLLNEAFGLEDDSRRSSLDQLAPALRLALTPFQCRHQWVYPSMEEENSGLRVLSLQALFTYFPH